MEETGALHIVTLLKDTDRVARPKTIPEANHLVLGMDDITRRRWTATSFRATSMSPG